MGTLQLTSNFGGRTLHSAGLGDTYVGALTPPSTAKWVATFGGTEHEVVTDGAVDSSGAIVMAGTFGSAISFGSARVTCGPDGSSHAFVAKLDPSGVPRWSACVGAQLYPRVAVDDAGDVYIAALASGSVDLGAPTGPQDVGLQAVVLIRRDATDGHVVSGRAFPTSALGSLPAVVVTSGGLVVLVTPIDTRGIDFGGGTIAAASDNSFAVVALTPSLALLSAHVYGDKGSTAQPYAVGALFDGSIALAGDYQKSLDLGCGPLPLTGFGGFAARLDPTSGGAYWSRGFATPTGDVRADYMLAEGSDHLVVQVSLGGTTPIDLGCGPLAVDVPYPLTAYAKYAADGTCLAASTHAAAPVLEAAAPSGHALFIARGTGSDLAGVYRIGLGP